MGCVDFSDTLGSGGKPEAIAPGLNSLEVLGSAAGTLGGLARLWLLLVLLLVLSLGSSDGRPSPTAPNRIFWLCRGLY